MTKITILVTREVPVQEAWVKELKLYRKQKNRSKSIALLGELASWVKEQEPQVQGKSAVIAAIQKVQYGIDRKSVVNYITELKKAIALWESNLKTERQKRGL